ncbi:DUF4326 domain-containing protein [Serinibacter salmoneus]|uniref:Uncharacterized protein DUF4326 n=1 Tax=Serinibacter salmoneus TaxID=556530 RepID=A0A2A9D1M6_9MICO|nr:DUF4326 domain-containing protein [Serinibacter salmoneus]PFG19852.1 uncharacterized protein DUF4326 [Serinibacter salmoneus]
MTTPKRVQMTRQRPWRAEDPDAVIVDRRTKWGNPYRIEEMRSRLERIAAELETPNTLDPRELVVEAFRADLRHGPDSAWWWYGPHMQILRILSDLHELAGRDLACWCPLSSPCHADVLLELANRAGSC